MQRVIRFVDDAASQTMQPRMSREEIVSETAPSQSEEPSMNRPIIVLLVWLVSGVAIGQVMPQEEIQSKDRSKDGTEGFVGWVESGNLAWQRQSISGVPDFEGKLLSLDHKTGARSQLTRLPAGWSHPPGYHRTNEEILVLAGDLTIGGKRMTKYSYAYYPAGYAHGAVTTKYGATLLHFWDAKPDFVPAKESLSTTRTDEVVEDWNFYDQPWTTPEKFGKWADFPSPPSIRLKLLRKDKKTGQMTWINWYNPGYMDTVGDKPWEVHPSWEEFLLLEGDLTFSECLPGVGAKKTTYRDGGYFWRPKGIRHVGPGMFSTGHLLFLHRSGTPIWADYYAQCNEGPTNMKS
jgi:quercetin dioxygenase-like cupin family protein